MNSKIRVMLVDDHEIVRTGIRRALELEADIGVEGEAANGAEALADPTLLVADVLVLDMNLPETNTLELIRDVRAKAPSLRILMFTMQPEDAYAASTIRAGAVGFLGKDRPTEELAAAIRNVGRGGTHLSDALSSRLREEKNITSATPHETLSRRERQIFERLVNGATAGDISRDLDLGTSTVATYLKRIREKIGVENNVELVQYAFRHKLVS